MSSRVIDAIKKINEKHNVGSLNNWGKSIINQGAKVVLTGAETGIDNYQLVELGFNDKGERTCKSLSSNTVKGYLIASVEEYIEEYETISSFYNGEGERARIVVQEPTRRFEVSNFKKDDTTKEIKNGQVAHYDATLKKYVISNGTANNADYATAVNKYVVVDAEPTGIDGLDLVRFEIA